MSREGVPPSAWWTAMGMWQLMVLVGLGGSLLVPVREPISLVADVVVTVALALALLSRTLREGRSWFALVYVAGACVQGLLALIAYGSAGGVLTGLVVAGVGAALALATRAAA